MLDQAVSFMILPQTKSIVDAQCKIFMHWTGSVSCLYEFLAPSTESGFSDFEDIVDRYYAGEKLWKGRERTDIVIQVRGIGMLRIDILLMVSGWSALLRMALTSLVEVS